MYLSEWKDDNWDSLIYAIRHKNCILLLGPQVAIEERDGEPVRCSVVLAKELAASLGPEKIASWKIDPGNLAQVGQYYVMDKGKGRMDLESKIEHFYLKRKELTTPTHRKLAELPFALIISSTPDSMFYQALLENGNKHPHVESYNFRGGTEQHVVAAGSEESPLLFYLCGTIDDPSSVVVSENDLIDFLAAVISKNPPLPSNILSELQSRNKSLLFLGFGFHNWYLRVLLHVLQLHPKESTSFALEQFAPVPAADQFQNEVIFFQESDYKLKICDSKVDEFVEELSERYLAALPALPTRQPVPDAPTIFICHASEDKERAASLYSRLEQEGFKPWLDREKLRGGDQWDALIIRTIKKEIDYFVVLLSRTLVDKNIAYVNKEINTALDRQMEFRKSSGINFIIPVKIEECGLLEDLESYQAIDISSGNVDELVKLIKRDQQLRKR